jgi:hypothetical protein
MFEAGKKYKSKNNSCVYDCVAVDGQWGWLKSKHGPYTEIFNEKYWKEYKEPVTTTAWCNVWERPDGSRSIGIPYKTKELAEAQTDSYLVKRVGIVKVEHVG